MTSAGQVLPDLHDRLRRQYRCDCALKPMFDSQQSGCDDMFWFPGLIICNHCRAHFGRIHSADLKQPSIACCSKTFHSDIRLWFGHGVCHIMYLVCMVSCIGCNVSVPSKVIIGLHL